MVLLKIKETGEEPQERPGVIFASRQENLALWDRVSRDESSSEPTEDIRPIERSQTYIVEFAVRDWYEDARLNHSGIPYIQTEMVVDSDHFPSAIAFAQEYANQHADQVVAVTGEVESETDDGIFERVQKEVWFSN